MNTLATSEGIHQNRAAAETHMGVLEMLVWWLKGIVAEMITSDLLRPMMLWNFGDGSQEFDSELLPTVSLGDTERGNFALDSQAVATLYGAGYLDDDQKQYSMRCCCSRAGKRAKRPGNEARRPMPRRCVYKLFRAYIHIGHP